AEGRPVSIRFRTPDEGRSTFEDAVRGEVSVEWSQIADFVIVRTNGTPVFFLANAVDDIDMRITHVLRGSDLLDSTHRVLALRNALGGDAPPVYAHLPLITGPGGAKLSKRHGAQNVEEFRDAGYLSRAVVNYLSLLGWAPGDDREVMEIDELVAEFDITRVKQSAATFDTQKLEWMNAEHIRRLPVEELAGEALPFAKERYADRLDIRAFEKAVALAQERSTTLRQVADQSEFLFAPDDDFTPAADVIESIAAIDRAEEVLEVAIAHVETCEWTLDGINMVQLLKDRGFKPRVHMKVLYSAITGRPAGLPLFDSIHMLGRESALIRLRGLRERLRS
ncbi:MAG: glutamate--tRNA ligase, partial [Acidimicrobiia bacterium]